MELKSILRNIKETLKCRLYFGCFLSTVWERTQNRLKSQNWPIRERFFFHFIFLPEVSHKTCVWQVLYLTYLMQGSCFFGTRVERDARNELKHSSSLDTRVQFNWFSCHLTVLYLICWVFLRLLHLAQQVCHMSIHLIVWNYDRNAGKQKINKQQDHCKGLLNSILMFIKCL